MRLLLCSEFYAPSRGGVQQVTRSVGEYLVSRGHEVTVATSRLPGRNGEVINGVKLEEFDIAGNQVRGFTNPDEVARYRRFLVDFPADAILVNAALQWTHDAALPVLDRIRARKLLIPCGFSSLYEPHYADYFAHLATVLGDWDHLVFHASAYRDIAFARNLGLTRFSIIPNGADPDEFAVAPDPGFRASLGIGEEDVLFLTVGSPPQDKGHAELAEAFCLMDDIGRPASLLLNGAWPFDVVDGAPAERVPVKLEHRARAARQFLSGRARSALPVGHWQQRARSRGRKILLSNLERERLVQAFLAADLFVFASRLEYSPLVLFEAAAAGTPFLSVPAGNAAEIAKWTGAGAIVPAPTDSRGRIRVRPSVMARAMASQARDRAELSRRGHNGRRAIAQDFNWNSIGRQYEAVLAGN
ncbi:MAG: alpha-L-glycero-D-manno-heptose alpha-1,3-glucosyltransferase [Ahrensia sp.]|nr:alpha-L-glycero-D-manno-heptose alpha-1,3-glucosyltransferase [Ahrensia sp.]